MTAYIPKNHPVSALLHAATKGEQLTVRDLEQLDHASADLPPGHGLDKYKASVSSGARKVAALAREGELKAARDLADDIAAQLAGTMSDEARRLGTPGHEVRTPLPTDVDGVDNLNDFARSVFDR